MADSKGNTQCGGGGSKPPVQGIISAGGTVNNFNNPGNHAEKQIQGVTGGTNPQIGGDNTENPVKGCHYIKSANQANIQSNIHGGTNPQIGGDNTGTMNFGAGGNNKKGNQVQGADHIKTENQVEGCQNTKSGIQANIQSNIHGGTNPQIAGDKKGTIKSGNHVKLPHNIKSGNQVIGGDDNFGNKGDLNMGPNSGVVIDNPRIQGYISAGTGGKVKLGLELDDEDTDGSEHQGYGGTKGIISEPLGPEPQGSDGGTVTDANDVTVKRPDRYPK